MLEPQGGRVRQLSRIPARGLTLIELAVTLAIMALMGLLATPPMRDYLANARLREAALTLQAQALRAQSEAVKRNGVVRLDISGDTLQLIDRTTSPQATSTSEVVLDTRTLPQGVSAEAAVKVDFGSEGRPVPFGSGGLVKLQLAGVTCGSAYRCPALRVDAGGAVRLCPDKTASNCS